MICEMEGITERWRVWEMEIREGEAAGFVALFMHEPPLESRALGWNAEVP
jgi:hypothetical protein